MSLYEALLLIAMSAIGCTIGVVVGNLISRRGWK